MMANREVTAAVKTKDMDEVIAKTEKLLSLLQQAKQLIVEISNSGLGQAHSP